MRRTVQTVVVLAVIASWPVAAAGQEPVELTLAQAVAIALVTNEAVIGAGDSLDQAGLSLDLARSDLSTKIVPNILGSFGQSDVSNQTYGLEVSRRFTTGTELRSRVGTSTFRNQLGNFYNSDLTVMVSQPLLRGFGAGIGRRNIDAAETRLDRARRARELTDQRVGLDVAAAYYRIVVQQELVAVAAAAVDRSRDLLEASEAKLSAGLVSQLDVLRAQQLLAQADGQRFDAQAAFEDAEDQLRFLMRRGSDYRFAITAEIETGGDAPAIGPDGAVELAHMNRLEIRDAEAALTQAEREVRYARNRMLPQVDVSLALTRRETADSLGGAFGADGFEPVTFLTVSMPLDRTAEISGLQSAEIDRNRAQREVELARMRIATEARRAVRNVQRLINSLAVAEARVEFSESEAELARLRYQRGLSNNLDVVTAETSLLAARGQRLIATADRAVARLVLRAVLGMLDPRADIR